MAHFFLRAAGVGRRTAFVAASGRERATARRSEGPPDSRMHDHAPFSRVLSNGIGRLSRQCRAIERCRHGLCDVLQGGAGRVGGEGERECGREVKE
jgi:hypothetical protein